MPDPTAILTDFMLRPPLAALGTVLLGASVAMVSDSIGLLIFRNHSGIFRALYFFAGLLLFSWLTLLLSIGGAASPGALQGIAVCILTAALLLARRRRSELLPIIVRLRNYRALVWQLPLGLMLLLIALSPPTDADSLDYHLGLPVQILRSGGLDFDALQLHYRMFGFGEMLNLLGLANGCASFGAFTQLLSLGWLLLAYRDFLRSEQFKPALLLVLSIPVLIALLPGSKHLLTGGCATTVAFLFLLKHGKTASAHGFLLAVATLFFAAGIKYSFLLSGGVLTMYAVLRSRRQIALKFLLAVGVAVVLYGPLLLFKLHRFHDPVAPFGLGMWGRDPVITWFCGFIRDYRESAFPFPLSVIVPSHSGAVSAVLGWGFVVLLLGLIVCFREYKAEVAAILGLCVLTLVLGQATSRFFVEPFLWMLPLWLRVSSRQRWRHIVTGIGQAQFFLTLPLSIYLAWSLGRGVLSPAQQESVMSRNGSFYNAAKWVNAVVPQEAMLLTDIRSRALLAMPVFPIEYRYARNAGAVQLRVVDSLLLHRYTVRYIAVIDPDNWFVQKYCGELVAGPNTFPNATRNPFNRGSFSMVIYRAKEREATP